MPLIFPEQSGTPSSFELPAHQAPPPSSAPVRPVKVMYIISSLSIGGAEMALYRLLTATNHRRFTPVVVSLVDQGVLRERIEKLGIEVHTTRMKPDWPTLPGLWRLIKLIRNINPDLIVGWMYHSCLAAQVANLFSRHSKPIVWSIHGSMSSLSAEKRLTAAVIKWCGALSRLPSKIVFVSQVGQIQHVRMGYRRENSCVIPNGIDIEKFRPSVKARVSVRQELQLAEGTLLIGHIGRYHPMKDHANFLQAAAIVSETDPKTHFLLIGRGVDQNNSKLCELIARLGLTKQVHLLGEREDTAYLAAALDIFALSSHDESCPNVIVESMACGVPCVVTNVGDAVGIVGESGRIVRPRDSKALAAAWKEMIDLGPKGRYALGLTARSRVAERFPIQLIVDRYETLYQTLLARNEAEVSGTFGSQGMAGLNPHFEKQGDPQLG